MAWIKRAKRARKEMTDMINEKFDIYGKTGLSRPEGAAGVLTAYVPEGPAMAGVARRSRPAVLILPGGAYEWCSERESEPIALKFVSAGWAAFVLSYSCAPHAFPTSLREAAASMVYIRRNADRYGVDPDMVAAIGFSAGGHLCGTLGTMYDAPEVRDIEGRIRPDALGLCYPVAVSWGRTHDKSFENISGGDMALRDRLSLDKLVRPDMPPTFIWHTRDDQAVPCRNSLVTATAIEEAGVPFALHIYAHGSHGLSTADARSNPSFAVPESSGDTVGWMDVMLGFFAERGLRVHDMEADE